MSVARIPQWADAGALFSPDRKYRYKLWRTWTPSKPRAAFCMLNPSTADEVDNDRTLSKCIGYGRKWGLGGIVVVNLLAYCSTDPRALVDLDSETATGGLEADLRIREAYNTCAPFVVAWGTDGDLFGRDLHVLGSVLARKRVHHLGLSKFGFPKHPLYLPGDLSPTACMAEDLIRR